MSVFGGVGLQMGETLFKVFWKVLFINCGGIGCVFLPLFFIDLISGTNLIDWIWYNNSGLGILHLIGIISVSVAIWDGQFHGHLKSTHWFWKTDQKKF